MNRHRRSITTGDCRAVSSVTAIAVMLAATVLVTAAIGTVVLVANDSADEGVQAGVSVEQSEGTTTVTWTEEGSAERISFRGDASAPAIVAVGESRTFEDLSQGDTLTIVAENEDGQTVLRSVEITRDGAAERP